MPMHIDDCQVDDGGKKRGEKEDAFKWAKRRGQSIVWKDKAIRKRVILFLPG